MLRELDPEHWSGSFIYHLRMIRWESRMALHPGVQPSIYIWQTDCFLFQDGGSLEADLHYVKVGDDLVGGVAKREVPAWRSTARSEPNYTDFDRVRFMLPYLGRKHAAARMGKRCAVAISVGSSQVRPTRHDTINL